jgi:hypothetical protein
MFETLRRELQKRVEWLMRGSNPDGIHICSQTQIFKKKTEKREEVS